MRGEFVRGDGLILPNNIMTYGVESLFRWALQNTGYALHMALADCNPTPLLAASDLNEPTIGVGGYARQSIARGGGWPTTGQVNGETYFESEEITFPATDAYSGVVSRLCLINHASQITGQIVVALSTPFGTDVQIDETTPVEQRTFKYRIYGR